MASKIDRQFIDNLQNFTNALEGIVDLLKDQAEKGDLINKMASAMDGDKISQMTEDIKNILDVSKKVDDRTKEILKEIKAARNQKESGMFGKIQDKDNKKKIVDGVGVIMLIAGGVLAIGMAFKIIGNVDFLSVVALSMGILMISHAFAKIAEIKELTPKKVLYTGLAVVGMATAVTISSWILQLFKPMGGLQLFSFILVSSALGVSAYFIMKALNTFKLKKKEDVFKILLLPIILPAMATGIVLSSWILQLTAPIGLMQAISAIFVGAILVVASLAVMFIMKSTKGVKPAQMLMATALIPLIAGGIVLASWIFQLFKPISNPMDVLVGSVVMAVALIAFAPTVYIIGKMPIKSMLIGALGVVVVSVAIMASSWILSIGKYDGNYPSLKWSFSVGLSIFIFSVPMLLLGLVAMSGAGAAALLLGGVMTLLVSATIAASSWILDFGKYDGNYPSLKWVTSVSLSIGIFGLGMLILGAIALTGIGAVAMALGAASVLLVSGTIAASSIILNQGNYTKYPSLDWAKGTSISLAAFGAGMVALGLLPFASKILKRGNKQVQTVAESIRDVSIILSGGIYKNGPTTEWAEGIDETFKVYRKIIRQSLMLGKKGRNAILSAAETLVKISLVLRYGDWIDGKVPRNWMEDLYINYVIYGDAYEYLRSKKFLSMGLMIITMMDISKSMVIISHTLSQGDWVTGRVPFDWTESLAINYRDMVHLYMYIRDKKINVFRFGSTIKRIAKYMTEVDAILSQSDFSKGPGKDWADNISRSMSAFTNAIVGIDDNKLKSLKEFSKTIKDLSKNLRRLNLKGLEGLNNLTTSVKIVSIIDNNKLKEVLNTLDENKDKLSNIMEGTKGDNSGGLFDAIKQKVQTIITPNKSNIDDKFVDNQIEMNKKFDDVIQKFDMILELMTKSKSGEDIRLKANHIGN